MKIAIQVLAFAATVVSVSAQTACPDYKCTSTAAYLDDATAICTGTMACNIGPSRCNKICTTNPDLFNKPKGNIVEVTSTALFEACDDCKGSWNTNDPRNLRHADEKN